MGSNTYPLDFGKTMINNFSLINIINHLKRKIYPLINRLNMQK